MKTVFFIVTAYGLIIDWAGPVQTMEICVEAAGEVQQHLTIVGSAPSKVSGGRVPAEDIGLGCYYVTKHPVVGEPHG